ncbi:MAG: amidohydrolase [Pseudobutyrivibrio sp.]|nr:amidohydrolase [Pseudobutyrivibrio sp.]
MDYCIMAKNLFIGNKETLVSKCILIKDDRIIKVVDIGEEVDFIDDNTSIIDAGDSLVMPGLIDAHTHFFNGALAHSEHVCCDIESSTSEEDCVRIISDYAKKHPNEKRIRGRGWFVTNWNDAPLPTKESLDAAFPNIPVYLAAADCHSYWLNSKALEECGITKETEVETGYIGKLPTGELSGMLVEMEACEYADRMFRDFSTEEQKEIFLSFMDYAASFGITSLSEMMPGEYDEEYLKKYKVIQQLGEDGIAKCRLHLFTKLFDVDNYDTPKQWKKELENDWLKLSGLKGFIDGVAETYTGLLLEPYTDRPDTTGIGVPAISLEELKQRIYLANKAGLPVRIHCIADGSVRMALDAFEYAINKLGRKLPNTIEHIENIHPDDICRFSALGVIPSMQPMHVILDCDGKINRIGEERIKYEFPWKSLWDSFGGVALGTDYPVVSLNPFDNIYAAVTRKNFDGSEASHNPKEALTIGQTLMGYTYWGAKCYGREDEIGTIAEGKLADVVILNQNLFEIPFDKIRDTKVQLTMVGGKIIYEA